MAVYSLTEIFILPSDLSAVTCGLKVIDPMQSLGFLSRVRSSFRPVALRQVSLQRLNEKQLVNYTVNINELGV